MTRAEYMAQLVQQRFRDGDPGRMLLSEGTYVQINSDTGARLYVNVIPIKLTTDEVDEFLRLES